MSDTTGTVYYKSSIEDVIAQKHESALQIAVASATDLALINKPETNKSSLDGFTNKITGVYRSLASRVAKLSGVEQAKGQKASLQKRYNNRKQELNDQIDELNINTKRMKSDIDGMEIENVKTRRRTWSRTILPLIICLLLGESLLNSESLSLLNSNGRIFQLILAISISAVLFLFIWGIVRVWHIAQSPFTKWGAVFGGTALVITSMYALAIMRIDYLNSLPNSQTEVSIHLMVGINVLFFIASLLAKLHFGITPEEKSKLKLFERMENEYKEKMAELQPLQSERASLSQKRDDEIAECESVIVMGEYYQDEIQQLHFECLSEFIHTSNITRSDGKVLSFENFSNGTPTLNTYSFISKNNSL